MILSHPSNDSMNDIGRLSIVVIQKPRPFGNTPDDGSTQRNIYYKLPSLSLPLRRQPAPERDSITQTCLRDRDGAFIHNRIRHPVRDMNHFISFQRALSSRVRAGGTGCKAPTKLQSEALRKNFVLLRLEPNVIPEGVFI